jgi:hypothetical protein
MLRRFAVAAATVGLVIPAVASGGAILTKGMGSGCPTGQQGTFAFTVNQVDSTDPGTVTASFSSGETWTVGAFTTTKRTREYFVNAFGNLLSASSSLDGKLILNRFWCHPPV